MYCLSQKWRATVHTDFLITHLWCSLICGYEIGQWWVHPKLPCCVSSTRSFVWRCRMEASATRCVWDLLSNINRATRTDSYIMRAGRVEKILRRFWEHIYRWYFRHDSLSTSAFRPKHSKSVIALRKSGCASNNFRDYCVLIWNSNITERPSAFNPTQHLTPK